MNEFSCILIPLDGSELAERALPPAMTLARKFGSKLILMRAIDFLHPTLLSPHVTITTAGAMTEAYKENYQHAHEYLETWQDKLCQQGFDVKVLLYDTGPAEGILEAATAHNVELIVMSTHGRGGFARWALGSVTDKVARHAPCSVLLVRQNGEDSVESEGISSA